MADSLIDAVYSTLLSDSTFTTAVGSFYYPYVIDDAKSAKYAVMFEVDDTRERMVLCDVEGGEARIQFNYVSNNFTDTVGTIETMITRVRLLPGDYTNIVIDFVTIGPTRDLVGGDQMAARNFARAFDGIFTWHKV